jgi:hypothetical protein
MRNELRGECETDYLKAFLQKIAKTAKSSLTEVSKGSKGSNTSRFWIPAS